MLAQIKDFFAIVYNWVMILQLLAVSFSVVFVMCPGKRDLKVWLRIAAETAVVFVAETLINLLLFVLSGYVRILAGINFPLAHFVTILFYVGLYCRKSAKSRVIMGATLFITAIDMAELGTQARNYISAHFPMVDFDWICVVADILIISFAMVIKKFSLRRFPDIPPISMWFVLIASAVSAAYVIGTIIVGLPFRMSGDEMVVSSRGALCLSYLLIYIDSVIMYLIIYFHSAAYTEKVTAEVENSLLKANVNMMVVSDQAMEEVREIRHDIGNQYAVIKMMLKEKKYDELEAYFQSMNIEFEDVVRFVDCGNSFLNSIMNMEILKAQSYKTRIVSMINVPPALSIPANDLSRIIVNLIDNSIEAISRSDVENKIVEVNISLKNDYLYIYVRNALGSAQQRDIDILKLNTVKDDYKNHGYGHKIVRRIVNRYNGEIHYTVENGEFIVEAMLDLKAGKGE